MGLLSDPVEWIFVAVGLGLAAIIYVRRIKTHGPPRYAPATPTQKGVCLVLLVAMVGTWGIDYARWHPFAGYEKQVALIVTLIGALYASRLAAILERQ